MRRVLPLLVLIALHCAAPAPPPTPAPEPPPPAAPSAPAAEAVIATVRVTASALNVRATPSTDADVVTQVKKNQSLSVLQRDQSWVKVRLANGEEGWVAARFVSSGSGKAAVKKGSCPADSDFAFTETPTLTFSDRPAKGMVVVDASVNTKGVVTGTKVVSNTTGDETLAFLAEREIKSAKFSPPIRECAARTFVFTYRRTF